jgi:predicted Kef-type K+ transport protein
MVKSPLPQRGGVIVLLFGVYFKYSIQKMINKKHINSTKASTAHSIACFLYSDFINFIVEVL